MNNLNIKFFSGPRIIFVILAVIVLAEVVYAIKVLTAPAPVSPLPAQKTSIQKTAGKISLNTSKKSFNVKEAVPVTVTVDTGGHEVSGVDLIVRFDPKILEATTGGIVKGKIFSEYPVVSVDSKKGLISISGVSNLKNTFKGTGQFALINLKAKAPGKTSLLVDFTKGSTTDSNVVETATSSDILEKVDNLELTIQ